MKEVKILKRMICMFLTALMVIGMLAGCRKTPESPIVVRNNNDKLIEKADELNTVAAGISSLREQTQADETYQYDMQTQSGLTVHVDASVLMPNMTNIPIIRVSPGKFSQETVSVWWEQLVGNTPMFKESSVMTKAEIEAQILNIKKRLENEDYSTYGNEEAAKAQDQADLDYYESIYGTAPDERTVTLADGTLKTVSGNPYMGAKALEQGSHEELRAASDDGTTFFVENYARDKNGTISSTSEMGFCTDLGNCMFNGRAVMEVSDATALPQEAAALLHMTPAEARNTVESLLEKTEAGFAIDRIMLISDAEKVDAEGEIHKGSATYYAYSVSCKRIADGVPCMVLSGSTNIGSDSDPQYNRKWSYETLKLIVHDSGIVSMSWVAPLSIAETKVESCTLLPFSDVKAIFEKMVWVVYDYRAKEFGQYVCNVDSVKLELVRVIEQGSVENGLLIPAWIFYGTRYAVYNDEEVNKSAGISLLCINAVDGSIINLEKGY